jgi:hypothetical protein
MNLVTTIFLIIMIAAVAWIVTGGGSMSGGAGQAPSCKAYNEGMSNIPNQNVNNFLAPAAKGELSDYFVNPSTEVNVPTATKLTAGELNPSHNPAVEGNAINYFGKQMANDLTQPNFNVADFLPKEVNTEWFQTDISNAQNEVDQGMLIDIAKFCQGVDTVGQSLKNPSYDIRGNIPCPKIVVSPFLNSSYDPDTSLRSLC